MMSREEDKRGRNFLRVEELDESLAEQMVLVRAYVHNTRVQAKFSFVVLRQGVATVQSIITDQDMVKWTPSLTSESIVDVYGKLVKVPEPTKCSQSTVEIQVETFFVVNRASLSMPFRVIEADLTTEEEQRIRQEIESAGENATHTVGIVGQSLLLDYRHLSLRTPVQQAIMRISSSICQYFREFLHTQRFIEVQTPKLLGGQSEGGSEVFMTSYFGQPACLAQSPQLHKQLLAACSGLERVFEIGPVFRAENSNTSRHLCEFHGLDMEMCFNEHYHEVLAMFSDLFFHIFDSLNEKNKIEIETVRKYFPAEPLVYRPSKELEGQIKTIGNNSNTLIIDWKQAIALLREDGVGPEEAPDLDDLSTPVEKRLGAIVKQTYGVDWYFLDKFPMAVRPFYTMPDPEDPNYSNSYDFMLRNQEIMSGAQRLHEPEMLKKAIKAKQIDPESVKFYIDAFRHGAMPHAGGGIGLERLVFLFLGIPNIRNACFFVRDPQRLTP